MKCVVAIIILSVCAACASKHEASGKRIVGVVAPGVTVAPSESAPQERVEALWSMRRGDWNVSRLSRAPVSVWTLELDGPIVHPVVLSGEHVYAVAAGTVSKVGIDGHLIWAADVQADGRPTVSDNGLLVPTRAGTMQLLDLETGDIKASHGGFESIRSPALPLGGRWAWVERDGILLTPDTQMGPLLPGPVSDAASDGRRMFFGNMHGGFASVTESGVHWEVKVPGPVTSHPIIGGHVIFVSFGVRNGEPGGVVALNLDDGTLLWVAHFGAGPSTPAALGDLLIVPSRSGDLVALDPSHGGTRWRAPGSAMHTTKPAIVGDAIYVGDGLGRLHRYDMADGGSVWSVELDAPITGDPVLTDELIILGTSDGRLVALGQ
jgi:outer membrane protein assembly factor BamB